MTNRTLLFVDTETTGLTHADRVITLGMVRLDLDALERGQPATALRYLIFNPGRPSNPFAAAVHGYDDWTLRFQPDFKDHALDIFPYFQSCESVFAHNAAFDERFLRNEFLRADIELPEGRFDCTMRSYKARHGRPGGLDKVLAHMGHPGRGKLHGALEDAWLCMLVYLWLEKLPFPDGSSPFSAQPENWVTPVEKPIRGGRPLRYSSVL